MVRLLNYILSAYFKHGLAKGYFCFKNVRFIIGQYKFVISRKNIRKTVLDYLCESNRIYNNFEVTPVKTLLNTLESIISAYPLVELVGVPNELVEIRESIYKSVIRPKYSSRIRIPQIKGITHYIHHFSNRKILFISNHRVNDQSVYEVPLINLLQNVWPYKILNNFCIVQVKYKGYNFLYELDAISIKNNIAYIFEIKNTRVQSIQQEILRMIKAANYINLWQSSLSNPIDTVIPVFYLRNGHETPSFNKITLSEVSSIEKIIPENQNWLKFPLSANTA